MNEFMETVMDKLVEEVSAFSEAQPEDGGIAELVEQFNGTEPMVVFWGDPVFIAVTNYPCFIVEPLRGTPTGGTTRDDHRDLSIQVTFLIDTREDWEVDAPEEATATRTLVKVADRLEAWLRTKANSRLDGMTGVRDVKVSGTEYTPQPRGSVFAKSAELTLTVARSRPRLT